jgi:hypothetical protein
MNIFNVALILGIVSPAFAVGTCAYLWRQSLQHFWWFIVLGGIALYLLMAVCLTSALSNIGISGALPGTPRPFLDPLMLRYLSFMLAWLAGTILIVFILRHFLSKS